MKQNFNYMVFLSALFMMAGCGHSKSINSGELNALYNEWKLTELLGESVPESSDASLLLHSDMKVSGSTGCNRFTGSFEAKSSGSIAFSPLGTTRMGCEEKNMALESKFLSVLADTESWKADGNILYLMKGNDTLAALTAASDQATADAGLNNTWELNYITGPRIAFEGLYPQAKPIVKFNLPDTVMTGNSSCNSFSIPFKLNQNKIEFGEGLSTLMACEGQGEQVFFNTLKSVNALSLSENGDSLHFMMDDVEVMRFTKK